MEAPLHIYLDVIWLLNFLIDLLLLLLTAIVLKRKMTKIRLLAGGTFASLYVLFLFSPWESLAMNPAVKTLYSLIIILIAFGFIRFRLFLQAWLMFYFVNFAAGGGLLGLHFFLQNDTSFIKGTFATHTSGMGSPISWLFVFIGFPVIYWYSKQRMESIETAKLRYEQIYPVMVRAAGMTFHLKGFVDSGNRLEDPISRRSVMIIDMTEVGNQFPDSIIKLTNKSYFSEEKLPQAFEGKLSLLPYRTVGENQQFMWVIKPDEVTVYEDEQPYKASYVLLGLSYTKLSDRQDYNCLLHPKMMQKKKLSS